MEKNIYKNLYATYQEPVGFEGDIQKMKKLEAGGVLKRNTLYKVEKIDMGSSVTYVDLLNVPAVLNSVALKFYEVTKNGVKECDIYNDARYNPYMSASADK